MHLSADHNSALLTVKMGESFIFKHSLLQDHADFDWPISPPHWAGSPIARVFNRTYFGMKEVSAIEEDIVVPLRGSHARGNFHAIHLQPYQRMYVSGHHFVGWSGDMGSLSTHIHFGISFWFLRKHFLPVFTGPGTVLIYSESSIEESTASDFQPQRVIAFDISRRLVAAAPFPRRTASTAINLISDQVFLRFLDPGVTIAERHSIESRSGTISIRHFLFHFLM